MHHPDIEHKRELAFFISRVIWFALENKSCLQNYRNFYNICTVVGMQVDTGCLHMASSGYVLYLS